MVKCLAGRPKDLVDPFALLAGLEQLSDRAREAGHQERKKYEAVFRQCRPLVASPNLAQVVIRLLGDREDKEVAAQISKIMKQTPAQIPPWAGGASRWAGGASRWGPQQLRPAQPWLGQPRQRGRRPAPYGGARRCFSCNRVGHLARNCPGPNGAPY